MEGKENQDYTAKCLWLTFLIDPDRRQRLKRGSKGERPKKMCPASSFSIFQPSFVATATFLELSVTLRHHLNTSVTGAVLFILSVVPPLSLCFCFFSYCQVFKQPAGFIEPAEWSWWTEDSMDSMWPIWPKLLYVPPFFVVLFLFFCEKREKGPLHWVGGYQLALLRHWGFH